MLHFTTEGKGEDEDKNDEETKYRREFHGKMCKFTSEYINTYNTCTPLRTFPVVEPEDRWITVRYTNGSKVLGEIYLNPKIYIVQLCIISELFEPGPISTFKSIVGSNHTKGTPHSIVIQNRYIAKVRAPAIFTFSNVHFKFF